MGSNQNCSASFNIPKMGGILFIVILTIIRSSLTQVVDEECVCVTYYTCNKTSGTVIVDGQTLFTERFGGCNCECPKNEIKLVCCRLPGNVTNSITIRKPDINPNPCGVRNPDGAGFKTSSTGGSIQFGEFPWLVDILLESGIARCGGALIHPSVVITAAHCVTRKRTYIVRAGEWDNSQNNELLEHRDLKVESKKIHEDYSPALHHNDVALLFLSNSFNLTSHIQLACLAPTNVALNEDKCFVVGRSKDLQGHYPPIPKRIDLGLVDKEICNRQLKQTKLGQYFNLHRSALCAGGEKDKDACLGDGGGPLMCPIPGANERYQNVGIVSWGVGCHREGVPGVYTNISYLREWIDKAMEEKNLKTSDYTY